MTWVRPTPRRRGRVPRLDGRRPAPSRELPRPARGQARPARCVREAPAEATPRAAGRPPAVRLTNPDRIYWPEEGVTKQDLADHYAAVWPRMAPHLVNRPVALLRCPGGIAAQCFFARSTPGRARAARSSRSTTPRRRGRDAPHRRRRPPGLIGLVQGGALEIHGWQSTLADLEHPDQAVFDLDPGEGVAWEAMIAARREVRTRSGARSRGLREDLRRQGPPRRRPRSSEARWDAVKGFAGDLARAMADDAPDRYVATITKAKRTGRILVDYFRNGRNNTAVAPYSSRAPSRRHRLDAPRLGGSRPRRRARRLHRPQCRRPRPRPPRPLGRLPRRRAAARGEMIA